MKNYKPILHFESRLSIIALRDLKAWIFHSDFLLLLTCLSKKGTFNSKFDICGYPSNLVIPLQQNQLQLNQLQLYYLQQNTCSKKRTLTAKQLAATTSSNHLQRKRPVAAKLFGAKETIVAKNHLQLKLNLTYEIILQN